MTEPVFYPGWADAWAAEQRAKGKTTLVAAPERKPRRSAPRTARGKQNQILERLQDVAERRARHLAEGGKGIPVAK